MNSMAIGGYKNANVANPRGGYQEPSIVIAQNPNHKNGQFIRPNKVALKYLDFKKDVDLDAHVEVFNSVLKTNAKYFKEYIINAFSYMLKNTTLDWCQNSLTILFRNLHRHFANVIGRFIMTSKYTWS
jgi:hypothetical protein